MAKPEVMLYRVAWQQAPSRRCRVPARPGRKVCVAAARAGAAHARSAGATRHAARSELCLQRRCHLPELFRDNSDASIARQFCPPARFAACSRG